MLALVLFSALAALGDSSRILGVFPSPGYSQFILAERLMTELANRGHEVTVISPFLPKEQPKNYKNVTVEKMLGSFQSLDLFMWQSRSRFYNLYDMYALLGLPMTETTLADPDVQALLHSNSTFDIVISEIFVNEAHMGFAHHFDAPLVLFSSIYASEWTNFFVGNPGPPSYVAHSGSGFTGMMGLKDRVSNLLCYIFDVVLREFYLYPRHDALMKKYFPKAPNLQDVIYNVSLVLLNSHPSYTESVPLVPNMIEIGGFHVTKEPLDVDLKTFLDQSKEGVVYFSMGSNLKSKNLSPEKLKIIMETFQKLPLKVLWKFEDENLSGQPDNVKIMKWLPQRGILGHRNVKAFISHCGFISTTETVYFGVPVVCVPIYVDQLTNAAVLSDSGMAVTVDFTGLTEESLTEALDQVLNNKSVSANAKFRSKLLHDRPVKPIDSAIYWIEYVIRNRGAPHLRSTSLNVRWYQFLYLDALGLLILTLVVIYKVVGMLRWEKREATDLTKKKL